MAAASGTPAAALNVRARITCVIIPARFVAQVLEEVGQKQIPGAILIPSGFARVRGIS